MLPKIVCLWDTPGICVSACFTPSQKAHTVISCLLFLLVKIYATSVLSLQAGRPGKRVKLALVLDWVWLHSLRRASCNLPSPPHWYIPQIYGVLVSDLYSRVCDSELYVMVLQEFPVAKSLGQ
jgi:hypothetical protein